MLARDGVERSGKDLEEEAWRHHHGWGKAGKFFKHGAQPQTCHSHLAD